jgi:hypothetical protein
MSHEWIVPLVIIVPAAVGVLIAYLIVRRTVRRIAQLGSENDED